MSHNNLKSKEKIIKRKEKREKREKRPKIVKKPL